MALTTTVKRGTGMPDSDVTESRRLAAYSHSGWVLSAFAAVNATQYSNTAIAVFVNGKLMRLVASGGTANAIVGTVAANTSAAFILTVGVGGTCSNAMYTGASVAALTMPTTTVADLPLALVIVAATATAFNGGTNSFADGAYTVSLYNFVGPSGIAITTENFSVVPG